MMGLQGYSQLLEETVGGMKTFFWVVVGIMFVIQLVASFKFEEIAQQKGHSGYFGWCFFLGLAGWLMVVALPDRNQEAIQATMQPPASSKTAQASDKATQQNEDDRLPEL